MSIRDPRSAGFSLVELMVAAAVVGILAVGYIQFEQGRVGQTQRHQSIYMADNIGFTLRSLVVNQGSWEATKRCNAKMAACVASGGNPELRCDGTAPPTGGDCIKVVSQAPESLVLYNSNGTAFFNPATQGFDRNGGVCTRTGDLAACPYVVSITWFQESSSSEFTSKAAGQKVNSPSLPTDITFRVSARIGMADAKFGVLNADRHGFLNLNPDRAVADAPTICASLGGNWKGTSCDLTKTVEAPAGVKYHERDLASADKMETYRGLDQERVVGCAWAGWYTYTCKRNLPPGSNGTCVYMTDNGYYAQSVAANYAMINGQYVQPYTWVVQEGWYLTGQGYCDGVYYAPAGTDPNAVKIGQDVGGGGGSAPGP